MPSKHFTNVQVKHLTNEDACRANGGSWCVEYKRDGISKSNGFHTAAVATAFATQLEDGKLDDDALCPPASRIFTEHLAFRQALEVIALGTTGPAVMAQIARNALMGGV
jgi:hypothetical protein